MSQARATASHRSRSADYRPTANPHSIPAVGAVSPTSTRSSCACGGICPRCTNSFGLESNLRNQLEPAYGANLSQVRLHTDLQAGQRSLQLRAAAFALGQDIFFAPNHYQPETAKGRTLIAHEVAHTVQQHPQNTTTSVDEPTAENEASEAANLALNSSPAPMLHAAPRQPQLQEMSEADIRERIAAIDAILGEGSCTEGQTECLDIDHYYALVDERAQLEAMLPAPCPEPTPPVQAPDTYDIVRALEKPPPRNDFEGSENRNEIAEMMSRLDPASTEWAALNERLNEIESMATPPEDHPKFGPPFFGVPTARISLTGIHPAFEMEDVPLPPVSNSEADKFIKTEDYRITPIFHQDEGFKSRIAYYTVYRRPENVLSGEGWIEFYVGPDSIEDFISNIGTWQALGGSTYMFGPPSRQNSLPGRIFLRTMNGGLGAGFDTWKEGWGECLSDPGCVLGLIAASAPLAIRMEPPGPSSVAAPRPFAATWRGRILGAYMRGAAEAGPVLSGMPSGSIPNIVMLDAGMAEASSASSFAPGFRFNAPFENPFEITPPSSPSVFQIPKTAPSTGGFNFNFTPSAPAYASGAFFGLPPSSWITPSTPGTGSIDQDLTNSFNQTFDQTTSPASPAAPGQGAVTVAPEASAGFDATHVPLLKNILAPIQGAAATTWNSVENPGERATLNVSNSRGLFDNQRDRFWRAVRRNPTLLKEFTDAGLTFPPGTSTTPYYLLPNGDKIQITIDHIIERQTDPTLALDSGNIRFTFRRENTVTLRQLHDQDTFQQGGN
jgi:hypothetical protein